MSTPSKAGVINFPIDFLDVGLLQARTFKPMGLVTLDKGTGISQSDLLEKIKTVALRQVKELQHVKPEDVVIFVRRNSVKPANGKLEFGGYIGRLTTPTAKHVKSFLEGMLVQNRPLQVEIWTKNDPDSPSHFYYTRSHSFVNFKKTERDDASIYLKVEAKQIADKSPGAAAASSTDLKLHKFATRFVCDLDVRAFRKDLNRRLCELSGISRLTWNAEVYFKREGPYTEREAPLEMDKSKQSFEDCVFSCIQQGKMMKIQYRLRPRPIPTTKITEMKALVASLQNTARSVQESLAPAVAMQEKPANVTVDDKRSSDVSFGAKTSFGNQPASTAPPPFSVPSSGSPFSQFVRSGPLRMSDAGSATSFKTLHDGFYAAVKQASETGLPPLSRLSTVAQPTTAAKPAAAPLLFTLPSPPEYKPADVLRDAARKTGAYNWPGQSKTAIAALRGDMLKGKAPETSSLGRNQMALKQVESMLTKFMINLNDTLLANFGDEASTLSILHEPKGEDEVQQTPTPEPSVKKEETAKPVEKKAPKAESSQAVAPAVRHNAYCDMCNHIIVGTRHKCANCPDWDCCDQCRVKADEVHPGHCLMAIKSLDVIPSGVKPSNWIHHPGVSCDGCDSRIVGPRFKCIACDDFDWCVNCEASPNRVHDLGEHHVFLKINKPFAESQRLYHCVWQGQEIVGEMRHAPARVRESQEERQMREREAQILHMAQQQQSMVVQTLEREAQQKDQAASIDTLLGSQSKGKADSLPALVPDCLYSVETKKRNERTEDEVNIGSENKKAAMQSSVTDNDLSSVQERLTTLFYDAQKLPGAQSVSTENIVSEKAVELQATSMMAGEDKEDYDMELVKDVNMPDGTKVLAGTQFDKKWTVKNIGQKIWPTSTILRLTLCSNGIYSDKVVLPLAAAVKPQQTVDIGVNDLKAGEALGNHHFYFRLELPSMNKAEGKRFGQQLWCQVQVVDGARLLSESANSFTSARGEKEVDQWEHQGSSLGSSLFQLPRAPQSIAETSEASAVQAEEDDNVSLASTDESIDDYEIIEPSTDGGDDDESTF